MPAEETTIQVQVQPNARQNRVVSCDHGVWQLKVTAPRVKGKANQELISFLSDILDTAKSNLSITRGMTSRRKTITIKGLTQGQITKQLGKRQEELIQHRAIR